MLFGIFTLGFVLLYQACSPQLNVNVISQKNLSGENTGDGSIISGMQSLKYSIARTYLPNTAGETTADDRFFRLLPDSTCTLNTGAVLASHSGEIVDEGGQLKYYASSCASTPQPIDSVPTSAYDPDFFVYLNGIFERYSLPPDPATVTRFNKVFCQTPAPLSEGFDVIVQKASSNLGATVISGDPDLTQPNWNYFRRSTMTVAQIPGLGGQGTIFKMTEDTSDLYHTWGQDFFPNLPDNGIFVFSAFAKSAGRHISLVSRGKDGSHRVCRFDLINGGFGACGAGVSSIAAGSEPYPDGWFRVWVAYDIFSGTTPPMFYFELANSSFTPLYTGDGVSGVYLSDAKIEQGPMASPVHPLTAQIISGQIDPVDGQYKSKKVASFEVRETLGSTSRKIDSDFYLFNLDIAGVAIQTPVSARLRTTIDLQSLDLNLSCWVESD